MTVSTYTKPSRDNRVTSYSSHSFITSVPGIMSSGDMALRSLAPGGWVCWLDTILATFADTSKNRNLEIRREDVFHTKDKGE